LWYFNTQKFFVNVQYAPNFRASRINNLWSEDMSNLTYFVEFPASPVYLLFGTINGIRTNYIFWSCIPPIFLSLCQLWLIEEIQTFGLKSKFNLVCRGLLLEDYFKFKSTLWMFFARGNFVKMNLFFSTN